MQQPSDDDVPFSVPPDTSGITPIDYPDHDSAVDSQEAYDEGMDDTIDANPYEYDDDPIRSTKKAMKSLGTIERITINQDAIKQWIRQRDGHPAHIKGITDGLDRGGLYIQFNDTEPDIDVEKISWDQFFTIFKHNKLAFLYRTKTRSGNTSKFYMFIHTPNTYSGY